MARYQQESAALTAANLQLQQARTRQQKINQQINLLVQENSAGLPFPSAPLESGLSSQLAQINAIDSVSLYLLVAYGSGLDFSSLTGYSALNRLYSFNSGFNMRSNCPELILSGSAAQNVTASGAYSGLGTVSKVNGGNSVTVTTSQGTQTINLDNCTVKLANIPSYSLAVGDVLVWKGPFSPSSNSWTASQVTCFH